MRADSGFWYGMLAGLDQQVGWSITVLNTNVATIAAIDEGAWTAIDYPEGGEESRKPNW